MKKSPKFSPEVRERAVRMVQEHQADYPSQWAAIKSIAGKIGCVPQTLHTWVRQHEVDAGQREGVSTAEAQRIKALESALQNRHNLDGYRWDRAIGAGQNSRFCVQ